MAKIIIELSEELKDKVKLKVLQNRITIKQAVTSLLETWVKV